MEAPFSLTVACDCSLMFGATLPPDRRMLPAPSLFFIVVSLVTIRPATAKVSHNTCEEVQAFQGVQDTRALPGKLFFYPISPFAFLGTITHYKVTLTNGSVLPNWLEYNHNTRTLQGLPMLDESGDYHLTIAAHGEECGPNTPAATANFVLHVHNSISVCEKQIDINQKPVIDIIYSEGQCAQDISVTFAEIIILNPAGSLTIQERLSLIYTMAEYLHLDPVFLTLIPFRESFKKHLWNMTIVSENIKCISPVENHYVGLCWPVGFGVFAMLYELVQVLQHNVQSSHLSQLLGYEIAGWRILQKGNHEKRHAGKRHRRQLMATPRPTMRPTKLGVKPTKTEAFPFGTTTLPHTKSTVRPSASSSSLYKDSGTTVPSYTDTSFRSVTTQRDLGTLHVLSVHSRQPELTIFQSLRSADPELSFSLMTTKMEAFPFGTTTLLHTKSTVRPSASSSSLYKDSETTVPSYTDTSFRSVTTQRDLGTLHVLSVHSRQPELTIFQSLLSADPELSPSLMTTKMEAFPFGTTTLPHTKSTVRPSASSSSLYKDSETTVPSYTDTSFRSVTTQRDLGTLHVLSVHSRQPELTIFQSLLSADPELSPSLMTTKMEAFPFGTTTLPHTKSTVRPSTSSSSLYKDSGTTVPSYTDISFHSVTTQRDLGTLHVLSVHSRQPELTIFQSLLSADPELSPSLMTTKMEAFPFGTTTLPHTKSTVRPSASSSSLYKDSGTIVPSYTDTSFHSVTTQRDLGTSHVLSVHSRQPELTIFQSLLSADLELSPSLMTTKMEAFPFGTTTLPHTKSTVRPSPSLSSLYKDSGTTVPSYTDISIHSVTTQRDLGTLHVLSVHSRQPELTIFQSLLSADPELSPSLMTASLTEFGRQDDLTSRTPPIVEFQQSQVQQQDMHSTPKKSEPKPNFTQYYLSFSGSASKTQFLSSVQATVDVSVSSEDTPSEKTPVADIPKQFVTNSTHSSSYTYLTAPGLSYEDSFFAANLPLLATTSTPAKLRFPFSTVVKSLFFSCCSHQKYNLFSNGRYASESFISNPQMKEHLFTDENSSPLTAVLTETSRWTMDLNSTDVMSAGDSATTGSASVHKLGLVPDASPVRQLYYNDNIPPLTTYSTEEFSIFLFTTLVEFGLLSRTSSVTTELPSLPLSTSKELTGSFGFHNISPVEEFLSSSRPISQKVFKADEHTSEPFTTVPETNKLLFIKDKASTLTKMQVETLLWNKPSHLIYITTSGVVLSSQFLSLDSLSQGTSQTHSWYSYDTLLLSLPVQYAGTPKLHFSKKYFSSYASGVRISVACPDVLQLETSDLILTGLLETKVAFHISRKSTSQKLKDSTVASLQAGLHTTSVFPGVQVLDTSFPSLHTGTSIFSLTPSEESSGCTETTQTLWLPTSQAIPTGQTNTSPRVVNAINWITATIGHKFSFSVPADTFYDQEDGDTPLLTLGMNPADGSPMGPGNWLHFNSQFQSMHGYPLAYDFQYSPQEFVLFATDSEGLKTSEMLTIELLRPTTIPCHNFTIRTKNSYHSFLRDRGRVYLFFEKLSKYLSSGSPGNMTLLHLRPGSTLITWYDHSFCTRNNRCARDEIQGVLVKLRLPGGNVHPDFVEAMLPEYNIYQTEDVAYGGTCSSNESLTSNESIAAFNNCHSWTRNIFFTLLISMCPAIMIILMIFWYCKYNTKIISRSFHRRPFLSYADLEMDVLKSRKAAVVEQEVPWPAELWLPVPTQSQQHFGRLNANLAASRLPPPPKYRLPPLY